MANAVAVWDMSNRRHGSLLAAMLAVVVERVRVPGAEAKRPAFD